MCPFSLFIPLSSSMLCLFDGGDVKVDRWGWQPDNRLLSSTSVTGLFFLDPMYPMCPLSSTSSDRPVFSFMFIYTLSSSTLLNFLTFFYFLPQLPLSTRLLQISPVFPFSACSPSLYSFTQCHYGPMLTEAFIKCQLYTRDHTVEGQDTMISDP